MSRSYKKTPVFNVGSESKKWDKQRSNRRYRRVCKKRLEYDLDEISLPTLRELSDIWDWGCDGWKYWAEAEEKDMRK
jgi:hypothetical protein